MLAGGRLAVNQRAADSGPVGESGRITSLDLIRGVAVLGILLMNAVAFKFDWPGYLNLSAAGSESALDWAVGIVGEIFVDQKFMGLFSLLFGAGMILFVDRATSRGRRALDLYLWRNALLLAIGLLHFALWEGDILMVYAVCSVFLIVARKLRNWILVAAGVSAFALSVPLALLAQVYADSSGMSLAGIWTPGSSSENEDLAGLALLAYFPRALGMMLLGAGIYRAGFLSGEWPVGRYRAAAALGLTIGLGLATLGVVVTAANDYGPGVAFVGQVPNTVGTIPASLGYLSLIVLWNNRADSRPKRLLRAVGRLALTNYLAQSVLGVLVLTYWLGDSDEVNRTAILVFVVAVWALQIWWSQMWLNRFRYGPAEWLWRCATYRNLQSMRRNPQPAPDRGAA